MKTKLIIGTLFIAGTLFIVSSYFTTIKIIKKQLTEICLNASEKYDCPPREALLVQLNDDTLPVRLKSSTIWAIGKMKVEPALPDLERYYQEFSTPGNKYSNCLREVEKAVGYMKNTKIDVMSFRNFNPE